MTSETSPGGHNSQLQVTQNDVPLKSSSTDEIYRLCMLALRCPNPQVVKYRLKESKDKLIHESIEWIHQDPRYKSWQNGEEVSLLWIKGSTGTGKTMLSIALIDELLQSHYEYTHIGFREILQRRWDIINGCFIEDVTSWRVLWNILLEMLDLEGPEYQKIYIIVDGLDECQDDDMADFLKSIIRSGLDRPYKIKWMLTSRRLDGTEELLFGHNQSKVELELDSKHISDAIKTYIAFKVDELNGSHRYGAELKRKIEAELTEKAEGTFLWVSLACKRLESVSREEALDAIQTLPQGLYSFYDRLWNQLNEGEPHDVQKYTRLLEAMLMAKRPLQIEEFANVRGLNSEEDTHSALVHLCSSFVAKQEEKYFGFIHQSARDYLAGVILSDSSAYKYSKQSPEEPETRIQEPSEVYTTWRAEMTATEDSASPQGCWSVEDTRETVGTSTSRTSLIWGSQDSDSVDNKSIYTSDVPQSSTYVQEIATSFFKGSEIPDTKSLERIHTSLSDLLRGFAQRIGGENKDFIHFEVMKFIQKKRAEISTHFRQHYIDDTEVLHRTKRNEMSLEELVGRWSVDQEMEDPYSPAVRPDDAPCVDDDEDEDEHSDAAVDNLRAKLYREIVTHSTAFQWLLSRVHRETILTTSEAAVMNGISTEIRQVLYLQRENRLLSSQTGPPKCSVIFQSDWDPLAFVSEQEYNEAVEEAIECAIVIVQGANDHAEALPCSEYVGRTWPLFGQHFMVLVRNTVCSRPGVRSLVNLFDSTKITAWIEPSGYLSMEVAGVVETIVEVGEVFAFITAALRSAQGTSVAFVTPTVHRDARKVGEEFKVFVDHANPDKRLRSIGQCWQDLFRNPVVVLGFPVPRRQPDQEAGLEIPLATLAALVGAKHITVFCGNIFLKGFCTVLVPTKYSRDTVYWHVLFNEDGSRISLTDSRVREVAQQFDLSKYLTLSGIETARHIVGWYRNVRNYAGSKEATYTIKKTGLQRPGSRFAFERVSISIGKGITVGGSVAIGMKDKPTRAAKSTDYHKQIEWAEEQYIVLYDCEDRRAWLIDGLSGLLHLVRAHLAHRRDVGREVLFSDNEIQEPINQYTGKRAAMAVLQNRANMDLKIYEKWNRIIEETSQKGQDLPETSQKTQKSWEQLPDLVGNIYAILSMLFDVQTDVLTADGFGTKIHKSPRRHLEGWDFQHVATSAISGDPLLPKVALLHDVGLGWVDLSRAINAVTLFGVGFGEILEPDTTGVLPLGRADDVNTAQPGPEVRRTHCGTRCARWATLPKGKDLLATTTPVIQDIMESVYRKPDDKQHLRELSTGIYWHCPDKVFEDCQCETVPENTHCDRVQVLLPTKFPNLFARGLRSPSENLPLLGGVIFGHSMKFPLIWKSEPDSVPAKEPPESSQPKSQSPHERNSELRMRVESSISRGSSVQPTDSRSTTATDSSSLSPTPATRSDTTSTSSKAKSAKNLVKRLFKAREETSRNTTGP